MDTQVDNQQVDRSQPEYKVRTVIDPVRNEKGRAQWKTTGDQLGAVLRKFKELETEAVHKDELLALKDVIIQRLEAENQRLSNAFTRAMDFSKIAPEFATKQLPEAQ